MRASLIFLIASMLFAAAGAAAETPRVLSDADRALYVEIFDLQEKGRWSDADARIDKLSDPVLLGYVKFERYLHPTAYRSSYDELKSWMAYYADHPDADEIYDLARKRAPRRAAPPQAPLPRRWSQPAEKTLHPDLERDYASKGRARLEQIEGRVRHLSKKEAASDALREIERHLANGAITERQFDRMRSWIAASYYYQGYVDTARTLADAVAARNGDSAVLAYWIAGLIAFRDGDMDGAHERFARMAAVEWQEDDLRSGAGFWAARSALAAGRHDAVARHLEIAARFPFTFYGQLALSQLGRDYDYNWTAPALSPEGLSRLVAASPMARRAVALAEVGKLVEADTEIRWAHGAVDDALHVELFALAAALDLPASQLEIALANKGRDFEAGLFPVPHFAPEGGFTADRALLYALMRQESKFKVEAKSRVGARGLMQLMPKTASYVAKDRGLQKGKGSDRLFDPSLNLAIGQDYVNHLIDTTANGDLFDVAVAYNGGPTNLRRWKREVAIEDQLLFIESIPNPESRDFVEKVLTNFWVYRARLGQPIPERDKVASGKTPIYEALDRAIGAAE